jgi:hypothetical protein
MCSGRGTDDPCQLADLQAIQPALGTAVSEQIRRGIDQWLLVARAKTERQQKVGSCVRV